MAFTYGFFNSKQGDRKYNAEQMSEIFDGILADGIIPTVGKLFAVTAANNGMQINIATGRAWFDHTWSKNDSTMILTVPQSDITRPRYDAVVLEVNHEESVRANAIKIITGVPSINTTKPILINNDKVHQYPLAYILVPAGATTIKAENIENMVGRSPTVFATGVLETTPLDDLWEQWKGEFDTWFAAIKLQLSGDIVTNLQYQIDQLKDAVNLEKASISEMIAGTNDTKYATPRGVKMAIGSEKGTVTDQSDRLIKVETADEIPLLTSVVTTISVSGIITLKDYIVLYHVGTMKIDFNILSSSYKFLSSSSYDYSDTISGSMSAPCISSVAGTNIFFIQYFYNNSLLIQRCSTSSATVSVATVVNDTSYSGNTSTSYSRFYQLDETYTLWYSDYQSPISIYRLLNKTNSTPTKMIWALSSAPSATSPYSQGVTVAHISASHDITFERYNVMTQSTVYVSSVISTHLDSASFRMFYDPERGYTVIVSAETGVSDVTNVPYQARVYKLTDNGVLSSFSNTYTLYSRVMPTYNLKRGELSFILNDKIYRYSYLYYNVSVLTVPLRYITTGTSSTSRTTLSHFLDGYCVYVYYNDLYGIFSRSYYLSADGNEYAILLPSIDNATKGFHDGDVISTVISGVDIYNLNDRNIIGRLT